jgi:hypothetical protein
MPQTVRTGRTITWGLSQFSRSENGTVAFGTPLTISLGVLLFAFSTGPRAAFVEAAAEIDVTPRPVAAIPPGTVIADRAPQGWSHLIVKSQPRIGADSRKEVSASTARLAGLFFTAMLADVKENREAGGDAPFGLSNVAVGLGTKINGRDTIVSSDTRAKLGANLGVIEGQVLAGSERRLQEMRCAARSRTMAVLDAPSLLLRNKRHRQVVFRYALLVDAKSGRLDALVWVLEEDPRTEAWQVAGAVQWLPPDKIDDCALHVDPDEFIFGVPTSKAFARAEMLRGRQVLDLPGDLKRLAAQSPLTGSAAASLEKGLRKRGHSTFSLAEDSGWQ